MFSVKMAKIAAVALTAGAMGLAQPAEAAHRFFIPGGGFGGMHHFGGQGFAGGQGFHRGFAGNPGYNQFAGGQGFRGGYGYHRHGYGNFYGGALLGGLGLGLIAGAPYYGYYDTPYYGYDGVDYDAPYQDPAYACPLVQVHQGHKIKWVRSCE